MEMTVETYCKKCEARIKREDGFCGRCYKRNKRKTDMGYAERERLQNKRWRESNPVKVKEYLEKYKTSGQRKHYNRNAQLKYLYGITIHDYNRMMVEQNNVCAICHKTSGGKILCVDHNHDTGEVRGLLCNRCNVNVGLIDNDKEMINRIQKWAYKWK